MLDMPRAREVFEASDDFTVGIEEEFGILDPDTLSLTQRYDELRTAADEDDVLRPRVAGELISSEIEIRSAKGAGFSDAVASQREARARLFRLAVDHGAQLSSTGAHPWSPWWEQRIIDTEHYKRLEHDLGYVARRNNTFSLHVHVGIRGADRAIAVCDRARQVLPELLAISANSPFLDGFDSGLASARSQIFTRSFPRCGIPEPFGDWAAYASHVELLIRTHSIIEHTQLWWSIRPHLAFPTVELRICDGQPELAEAVSLASLSVSLAARIARALDDGEPISLHPHRLIEENMWRAIRHGLGGEMIDLDRGDVLPTRARIERLIEWVLPVAEELGAAQYLSIPEKNAAERQIARVEDGASFEEIYAEQVAATVGERAVP